MIDFEKYGFERFGFVFMRGRMGVITYLLKDVEAVLDRQEIYGMFGKRDDQCCFDRAGPLRMHLFGMMEPAGEGRPRREAPTRRL